VGVLRAELKERIKWKTNKKSWLAPRERCRTKKPIARANSREKGNSILAKPK
jgi:hypothetical protein